MADPSTDKRRWRTRVRTRRRARLAAAADHPDRYRSERDTFARNVTSGLLESPDALRRLPGWTDLSAASHQSLGCVAVYRSLPTEPPTEHLLAELIRRAIPVILPELLPDKDLQWRRLEPDGTDGARLGVAAISDASLIVVPALSVDTGGYRLGQGGGSYDRALARRAADALVVALIFDDELSTEPVPREPHDARVDAVVRPGFAWTDLPLAHCRARE